MCSREVVLYSFYFLFTRVCIYPAGKYGYVDVNGDVKIIQYGADAMGFQPQGDLPEGIIIPPPVSGNCTDCGDYDYNDGERSGGEEEQKEPDRFQVGL